MKKFIIVLMLFSVSSVSFSKDFDWMECHVSLSVIKRDTLESVFSDFRSALQTKDSKKIANLVSFPIGVTVNGKTLKLKSKKDFLPVFNKIFNAPYISSLLDPNEASICHNDNGIGIANGKVWMSPVKKNKTSWTLKIYSINP